MLGGKTMEVSASSPALNTLRNILNVISEIETLKPVLKESSGCYNTKKNWKHEPLLISYTEIQMFDGNFHQNIF